MVEAKRCALTKIKEGGLAVFEADSHEAAAANIAGCRINDRQRVADRHCCINRIAAVLQHVHTNLRSQMLSGDHHAVLGFHGLWRRSKSCPSGQKAEAQR